MPISVYKNPYSVWLTKTILKVLIFFTLFGISTETVIVDLCVVVIVTILIVLSVWSLLAGIQILQKHEH